MTPDVADDMDTEGRYRLFEAARVRGELSVQRLWLRYLALGGNRDEFDVDGYLQGLLTLETFEQDILAVALNERLDEVYRSARIPVPTHTSDAAATGDRRAALEELFDGDSSLPPAPDQTD
jgi:hypothetical protein